MTAVTESLVESAALAWLEALGYAVLHGPDIAGAQARVIDFDVLANNDWLAVNPFTVSAGHHTRRPDVVLFVNGLPLAVIEIKNSADENATVRKNVTVDWTIRENVRTQLRVLAARVLRRHGYPPDKQEKATQTVLEQAEVLSEIWAGT